LTGSASLQALYLIESWFWLHIRSLSFDGLFHLSPGLLPLQPLNAESKLCQLSSFGYAGDYLKIIFLLAY
jgi:hypothetical protein